MNGVDDDPPHGPGPVDEGEETVIEVPPSLDGERLDRALSLLLGWSRADSARVVADGGVLVDGRAVSKSHRLECGSTVAVVAGPPRAEPPRPEHIEFEVAYEDPHLLVVVKPAGLVVHPGAGNADGTLVNGLLWRYPEIASVGDPMRPGIVHRLDRDTSGLMLVARSPQAHASLVEMLSRHMVSRHYRALVWGELDAPRGVIDAPIGRSTHRPTRMAVRDGAKPARTHYEVVARYDDPVTSLLELQLETGRTHQIRVHCAAIGHPVVGDATYGGGRESLRLHRPFLHARHLELDHPVTGEHLSFDAPLPADLVAVLDELAS